MAPPLICGTLPPSVGVAGAYPGWSLAKPLDGPGSGTTSAPPDTASTADPRRLTTIGWVLVVIAVVALVNLVVVLNRKRRGQPGQLDAARGGAVE